MKRKVELFTAGCPVCEDATRLVKSLVCDSCELEVLNPVTEAKARSKAREYGLNRLPAIVVDGKVADCCTQRVSPETLRMLGVGVPS